VNVPSASQAMACALCGSKSGRDADKFDLCKLTAERSASVLAPGVAECPIIYECQVVHSNDVQPSKLTDEILSGAYQDGDFHRVYFGKILATTALEDPGKLLA
jgi:flavin reductase (DIM6/NTAB) family NADH-FMN oxidoreductase RutF